VEKVKGTEYFLKAMYVFFPQTNRINQSKLQQQFDEWKETSVTNTKTFNDIQRMSSQAFNTG
jgi:hypothetical protein